MKVTSLIIKIVVALAAVAGAVYLAATYGEKIVAWAKKMLGSCPCCKKAEEEDVVEAAEEATEEAPAEEVSEEAAEGEVVAAEADFAE